MSLNNLAGPERELKPVFQQELFVFEDPSQIPDHYDEQPTIPSCFGRWAIYGRAGHQTTVDWALDVASLDQAYLLASAKQRHLELLAKKFGFALDVYILDPDLNYQCYYAGQPVSDV